MAAHEGRNDTRHSGVQVYRVTSAELPTPTLYAASLILVGSGAKSGTLGGETFRYDSRHYLVVTAPMPMLCQTLATTRDPLLSLVVGIEMDLLRSLLLEVDALPTVRSEGSFRSVFRAPLVPELEDVGCRLLSHLADDRRARLLAPQTIREILFHVLEGPFGYSLRTLAEGPVSRLGRVLHLMNERYSERFQIGELADLANMSLPTFHQHFKSVTRTSPLQYLKAIRLTRARQMLQSGLPVKSASYHVGYESESQFSREFRRFFGYPPSEAFPHRPDEGKENVALSNPTYQGQRSR